MLLAQNVIAPMFNLITDLTSKQELKSGTCPSLVAVGFWEGFFFVCVCIELYFFQSCPFIPLELLQ